MGWRPTCQARPRGLRIVLVRLSHNRISSTLASDPRLRVCEQIQNPSFRGVAQRRARNLCTPTVEIYRRAAAFMGSGPAPSGHPGMTAALGRQFLPSLLQSKPVIPRRRAAASPEPMRTDPRNLSASGRVHRFRACPPVQARGRPCGASRNDGCPRGRDHLKMPGASVASDGRSSGARSVECRP